MTKTAFHTFCSPTELHQRDTHSLYLLFLLTNIKDLAAPLQTDQVNNVININHPAPDLRVATLLSPFIRLSIEWLIPQHVKERAILQRKWRKTEHLNCNIIQSELLLSTVLGGLPLVAKKNNNTTDTVRLILGPPATTVGNFLLQCLLKHQSCVCLLKFWFVYMWSIFV